MGFRPKGQGRIKGFEQKLITVGFLFVITIIPIWNLLSEDRQFSEQENRMLEQKPALSINNLLSGEFMENYEAYFADQFAGKIGWTTLKAKAEYWQGKREANGVFIGEDSRLLEDFSSDENMLLQNLDYLNGFAKKEGRKVSLMLVPTSIELYKDKLPLFAEAASQKSITEKAEKRLTGDVKVIDPLPSLSAHKEEDIYFKSDHHWTMRGAYYAYAEAAKELGFSPYPIDDFTNEKVSETFLGTYASKVIGFPVRADSIELFEPRFPASYKVSVEDTGEVTHSLFHWESLQQRDQYSLFLSGNHSLLTIHSNVKNGRKLAIIKDSYAHVLIPFLANHYEEIHVLDLRYFHTGVNAYLEENNLQEILFVYNIPNFMADPNLIWLKS